MPTRDGARSAEPSPSAAPSSSATPSQPPAERPEPAARPQLPPGLDLLWGRRESGSRGPRRGLSVDDIVEAAVAIADRDGLEGVSMARVAEQLGFTTMSLYRYVASKEELLQLMWNASAKGTEHLRLEGTGWRAQLRDWSIIQRKMIDQHPWITQMPMAAPPLAPNSLRFVEIALEALDGTGLTDGDKIRIIGLLSSYTLGEARMAHDAARAAAEAQATGTPQQWSYEALLRELVDEREFPRLHRLAWSEVIGDSPAGVDEWEEFLFGVERILDSTQALIDQAAGKDKVNKTISKGKVDKVVSKSKSDKQRS